MNTLPLYPVYIVDIAGSALTIVFTLMALRLAFSLIRLDRQNIVWTYLAWLSWAFAVFAFSRGIGHILQHALVFSGRRDLWRAANPISGSLNTLSFVFMATVSLFFVRVRRVYERIVADKRRMEEINIELMRLNQDMESMIYERTLSMMALSVADKIRNPATVIGGTAKRILKAEGLDSPLKERLADFLVESQKLDSIVKDYEMIRKSKQMLFKFEDLNDLLRGAIQLVESDITDKAVELSVKTSPMPLRFNANRQLIKVAIVHLLKNSLEAVPQGGRVEASTGKLGDSIYLEVKDNGHGIPEADISKVFSLFFSTKKNRIGMGLPLAKQIVEEHGGTISAKSTPGQGTAFRLVFPIRWKEEEERDTALLGPGGS